MVPRLLNLPILAFAAALASDPVLAQKGAPFQLPSGCAVPFVDLVTQHKIDAQCGASGDIPSSSTGAPHQVQNRQKNDFCVTGTPRSITVRELTELQKKADEAFAQAGVTYDREHLPADRSPLRKLGEGALARLVAFPKNVRYSNIQSGGESVNCHEAFNTWNDIHIELAEEADGKGCELVSAEVSPHFRPIHWTPTAIRQSGRPIRITGPLFFDASHHPCKNGLAQNDQARASNWEIHPAYNLEICRYSTAAQCKVDDDAAWQRLE